MDAMKILVVDDDPDMASVMEAVLQASGHSVEIAISAGRAIPRAVKIKPDVVLCDLMMPQINGLELCGQLRERKALDKTVIICISSRTNDYWQDRAKQFGADGFITKPIDPLKFADQVLQIVTDTDNPGAGNTRKSREPMHGARARPT